MAEILFSYQCEMRRRLGRAEKEAEEGERAESRRRRKRAAVVSRAEGKVQSVECEAVIYNRLTRSPTRVNRNGPTGLVWIEFWQKKLSGD